MGTERATGTGDERSSDAAIATVEKQFGAMYRQMKVSMRHRADQVHRGLPVLGYVVLSTLERRGPTHAGVLAELLEIDKGLLSRQLRTLEELDLIEREADPSDGRAFFVSLSHRGKASVDEARRAGRDLVHEQLSGWSVADLEKLAELLARVNAENL